VEYRADLTGLERNVGFVIDGVGTTLLVVFVDDTVIASILDRANDAVVRLPRRTGTVD
jgi:hypothetical protein